MKTEGISMGIFGAEFIGTLLLVLLGNGVIANVLLKKSKGENSGWIVISAGWAFAIAVGVYATAGVSGGHINPAVTIGFALIGKTPWDLVPVYVVAQLLGAFVGAFLVWVTYHPHWRTTENMQNKLMCFGTAPAIRKPLSNFLTEVIATAVLLFGILSILSVSNQVSTGMAPYLIGILFFAIGLSLGGPTGFAVNPARDFAPRLAHAILPIAGKGDSDWGYALVPILGPLVGGALGALLYQAL